MNTLRPFVALALSFICSACSVVDRAVASYVIERQERIRTYEGTYVERGTVPGDPLAEVRSRVRFAAPHEVVIEVLEPAQYRGDTVAYLGSELWFYSARSGSGIHVRSVPWDQERWRAAVRETVRSNGSAYDYEQDESKVTLAGRVAVPWRVVPRAGGPSSRWWTDDEFTTTLRVDAGSYSFRFDEVAFNRPTERPRFDPPDETVWFEWDMAAPSVPVEEVKQYANFPLLEPDPELGLERTRIVWSKTDLAPVIALVYERGPFYASVAENKDEGFRDKAARGLDVDLGDGTKGRLAAVGALGVLWFSRGGVQVTIMSNLPHHELLTFARSLRSGR